MSSCNKVKRAFYKDKVVYADEVLATPIIDAKSDYNSDKGEGRGVIVTDEVSEPFFFQTDLNTSILEVLDALIQAFDITVTPTSAYEIALNTNLQAAKVLLENIKDQVP